MTVSVIVSTYNRPDALELCLKSLLTQSRLPGEIIVGDDGSGPETKEVIERLSKSAPVKIIHVWQEDRGFRLAAIRNKSVLASTGEYIIQIDGDVVPHRRFVEDHLHYAKQGYYLRGSRVMLGKELTVELCRKREMHAIRPWSKGIEKKRLDAFRLPLLSDYMADRHHLKNFMLGCNMSYFRSDFFAVNGYDEFFEGWGCEDCDFFRRLIMNGVKIRRLKFAGIVYHLWHKMESKQNLEKHTAYSLRQDITPRCTNGALKDPTSCSITQND